MIPYTIIRSQRKTLVLTFDQQGELLVRSPKKVSATVVETFILKNQDWIIKHQAEIKATLAIKTSFTFSDGQELSLFGKNYKITTAKDTYVENDLLFLPAPKEARQQAYDTLLTRLATEHLAKRVDFFDKIMGLSASSVKITHARARWGSCNTKGRICFSRYLICASPPVIDYVVVHELAHLREHNHSTKFWRIVESILPNYRQLRKLLKDVYIPF